VASVAAVDINEATLRETATLAAERAGTLATFTASITDRAAVEALSRAVADRFGAVDGLINCAGIIQPFVRLRDLDYAAIDRVFDVNWRGTLYMTKTFLPALLARPESHIVNISRQKHKALAADRAARDILDGMERNQFRVLVGSDAKLLDVLYRLSPRRAAAFIAKQMRDLLR
jgi:NAD(P)-dependent dehydrogenase (short-subunit alcohol dehydrogenase family)